MVSDWSISIWIWTVFLSLMISDLLHCSNPYQIETTFILPDFKDPSKTSPLTHPLVWLICHDSISTIAYPLSVSKVILESFLQSEKFQKRYRKSDFFSFNIYGVFGLDLNDFKYFHVFEHLRTCLYPNLNPFQIFLLFLPLLERKKN